MRNMQLVNNEVICNKETQLILLILVIMVKFNNPQYPPPLSGSARGPSKGPNSEGSKPGNEYVSKPQK